MKKKFEILGGMFGFVKIRNYCIPCGCERISIITKEDIFNGFSFDECKECFEFYKEKNEEETAGRMALIIAGLKECGR